MSDAGTRGTGMGIAHLGHWGTAVAQLQINSRHLPYESLCANEHFGGRLCILLVFSWNATTAPAVVICKRGWRQNVAGLGEVLFITSLSKEDSSPIRERMKLRSVWTVQYTCRKCYKRLPVRQHSASYHISEAL